MYIYEKGTWETKDHQKLRIEDMKTSHIENTIKYLERNSDFYDECYGDMYDVETFDYEDNSHLVDQKIEELEQELKKRCNNA